MNTVNINSAKPIVWRLLIPLSLLLILIIASASKIIFLQHKTRLNDQLAMMSDRFAKAYHADVTDLAEKLELALIPIASNYHVKQYIESGDKESLYKTWRPIYEIIKVKYGINHFTFMDKYRRRILRVHLPEQSEGIVNRHTLLEAERTGKVAWGIEVEMGSLEIPTLRVVQPVLTDNKIVGYLELGEDIDGLLSEIHERTNVQLIGTVFKENIDRQRWVETMSILNREANWDKLIDAAIFYTTLDEIPNSLADLLNTLGSESIIKGQRISFDDKIWQVSEICIIDAAGNDIGDLIFMVDATSILDSFRKSTIIGVLIISILLVTLLSLIYSILKRTDNFIMFQQGAMIENERNYKELFNSIADSIVIYDLEGNFIDYNQNANQLYGYSRSELKDIRPIDIVHPDSHNILRDNQQRIRAGETTLVESVHLRKDGTSFPVEIKSLMIKIGEKLVILSVIRDISDRKKQEQVIKKQSDWMDALLKTPTEGLWIFDSIKKRLVLVNEAYVRMSGYSKDELLNMTIPQLEAKETPNEVGMRIKKIIQRGWDIFESKHRRKDGTLYDVQISVSYDRERDELYGYIRDITEEKRIKNELEVALLKYKTLFNSFPLGITIADGNGEITEANNKAEELLGIPKNEQIKRQITGDEWKIIQLDGTPMPSDMFPGVSVLKENKTIENVEMGIVKGTNNITWINVTATPIFLDTRMVVITYGDISDRIRLEQELILKDNAIQNSIIGIALSGNDGLITYVNKAFVQLWGYETVKDVVGRSLFEFWQNPDKIVEITESLKTSNSWTGERVAMRKDSSTFHCQISANFLSDACGNVTHFMGSFWDITEKIQIQERLAESESQYRSLFEQSPYGVLLMDINTGQTIESNEIAAQQLGYTLDEFLSIKVSDYEVIETPEETSNRLKSIERGKKEEFDTLHRTKSGRIRNVRVNVQPLILQNRKYVFAIFQDLTERVESESLYNNILKTAIDGFLIFDLEGQIVETNNAYCEMVGYSHDELLKKHLSDLDALEDAELLKKHFKRIIDIGKDRFETRLRCKNGKEIVVEVNVVYLAISGGIFVSSIKDISERKEREELVLNSLREKELLLREIHHRVKNNLQIISSLLYLQSQEIDNKEIADMLAKNIQKLRAMSLVHDFLYQSENLTSIDFKQYILDLSSYTSESFSSSTVIRINVIADEVLPFEKAIYIGLLTVELLINSMKYAFEGRSQGEIRIVFRKENGNYLLTYADNGIGYSNNEDFLKEKSFGITMMKTLAKQLKGNLELSSQGGAQAKLIFPYTA